MVIARSIGPAHEEFLLLGLSRRNLEALAEGRPIHLTSESHGAGIPLGWTIFIVSGEDEASIVRDMRAAGTISEETTFVAMPNGGTGQQTPQ